MKTIRQTSRITFALLALAATFAAASAQAQTGKTREEVKAELAEATRTGNIIANGEGEGGLTLRELYPQRYPAVATAPGLTRAQVLAELEGARRTGDLMADGDLRAAAQRAVSAVVSRQIRRSGKYPCAGAGGTARGDSHRQYDG